MSNKEFTIEGNMEKVGEDKYRIKNENSAYPHVHPKSSAEALIKMANYTGELTDVMKPEIFGELIDEVEDLKQRVEKLENKGQ